MCFEYQDIIKNNMRKIYLLNLVAISFILFEKSILSLMSKAFLKNKSYANISISSSIAMLRLS